MVLIMVKCVDGQIYLVHARSVGAVAVLLVVAVPVVIDLLQWAG